MKTHLDTRLRIENPRPLGPAKIGGLVAVAEYGIGF